MKKRPAINKNQVHPLSGQMENLLDAKRYEITLYSTELSLTDALEVVRADPACCFFR
ncbi:hypothetical protein E9N42_005033 [Escherichia coli]|nr:hypothetical protein [Escherichia coli]